MGGSCPNIACLPSKNIIHSAKVASCFQRSEEFGITKDNWRVEMSGVWDRKRKMVDALVQVHLDRYRSTGTELLMGQGRFVGERTIEVTLLDGGTRLVRGERVFINTGSRAAIDHIPGLSDGHPLTHVEALDLDYLPEHLVVLGGGYVGLELAHAMRRFGSRVTIVEQHDCLTHQEDQDVSEALEQLSLDEGIELVTGAAVTRVEGTSGKSVALHFTRAG
ncbi:MAG: FAD-dependent oxidoreductase [Bryobacterales bacterium]|nr:FAD-dependent oxidoreductase [Bryobacterales bacterium]